MSNTVTTTNTSALANIRSRARATPVARTILLCDTSGSMGYVDTSDQRRRIDHLAEILSALLSQVRLQGLFTFDSFVREMDMTAPALPDPSGSTALHVALQQMALVTPKPAKLIIVCDGHVDQPEATLAEARSLGVPIDTYYVGPDHDRGAQMFLRSLATATGGDAGKYNIATQHKALTDQLVLRITHSPKAEG